VIVWWFLTLLAYKFCSKFLEKVQGAFSHHSESKNSDHFLIGCSKQKRSTLGASCLTMLIVPKFLQKHNEKYLAKIVQKRTKFVG